MAKQTLGARLLVIGSKLHLGIADKPESLFVQRVLCSMQTYGQIVQTYAQIPRGVMGELPRFF